MIFPGTETSERTTETSNSAESTDSTESTESTESAESAGLNETPVCRYDAFGGQFVHSGCYVEIKQRLKYFLSHVVLAKL